MKTWKDTEERTGSMGPGHYSYQPYYLDDQGRKHIIHADYLNYLERRSGLLDQAAWGNTMTPAGSNWAWRDFKEWETAVEQCVWVDDA